MKQYCGIKSQTCHAIVSNHKEKLTSVPGLESYLAEVGGELQGVDLDTHGGDVHLLEFATQVTLNEGGLSGAAIADKDELER